MAEHNPAYKDKIASFSQAFNNFYSRLTHFISSPVFLRLVFVWFIIQAVYMAISTKYAIPPDERYHYNLVKLFVENGWSPFLQDQQGYNFLGEVVRSPFMLYHYLLSLPAHVFSGVSEATAIFTLRLFNIGLGIGSFIAARSLANRLRFSPFITNLSLFMLANTLMFVFLTASISYDNFFILLGLLSFILLLDLLSEFRASTLLLLAIVLVSGLMTKINFVPLAIAIIALLLFRFGGKPQYLWNKFQLSWQLNKRFNLVLLVILLCLGVVFTQKYVGNISTYQTYSPSFAQVNPAACEGNVVYPCGPIQRQAQPVEVTANILEYLPDWTLMLRAGTYGIQGHKFAADTLPVRVWTEVLILLALVAFSRKYTLKDGRTNIILGIVGFYLVVLLVQNFNTYRNSGVIELALQGRYIFAVLPVLYLFANRYILEFLSRTVLKTIYIVGVIIIFVLASLPTYILITDNTWHTTRSEGINKALKDIQSKILPAN